MIPHVVIGGTFASGLLLIASLLYGGQFIVNNSGSATAKLAVQKYSSCLSLQPSYGDKTSTNYTICMSELDTLVKTLVNSGELSLDDCEVNETVAYCVVWVWYVPQQVVVNDKKLLDVIRAKLVLNDKLGKTKVALRKFQKFKSDAVNLVNVIQNKTQPAIQNSLSAAKVYTPKIDVGDIKSRAADKTKEALRKVEKFKSDVVNLVDVIQNKTQPAIQNSLSAAKVYTPKIDVGDIKSKAAAKTKEALRKFERFKSDVFNLVDVIQNKTQPAIQNALSAAKVYTQNIDVGDIKSKAAGKTKEALKKFEKFKSDVVNLVDVIQNKTLPAIQNALSAAKVYTQNIDVGDIKSKAAGKTKEALKKFEKFKSDVVNLVDVIQNKTLPAIQNALSAAKLYTQNIDVGDIKSKAAGKTNEALKKFEKFKSDVVNLVDVIQNKTQPAIQNTLSAAKVYTQKFDVGDIKSKVTGKTKEALRKVEKFKSDVVNLVDVIQNKTLPAIQNALSAAKLYTQNIDVGDIKSKAAGKTKEAIKKFEKFKSNVVNLVDVIQNRTLPAIQNTLSAAKEYTQNIDVGDIKSKAAKFKSYVVNLVDVIQNKTQPAIQNALSAAKVYTQNIDVGDIKSKAAGKTKEALKKFKKFKSDVVYLIDVIQNKTQPAIQNTLTAAKVYTQNIDVGDIKSKAAGKTKVALNDVEKFKSGVVSLVDSIKNKTKPKIQNTLSTAKLYTQKIGVGDIKSKAASTVKNVHTKVSQYLIPTAEKLKIGTMSLLNKIQDTIKQTTQKLSTAPQSSNDKVEQDNIQALDFSNENPKSDVSEVVNTADDQIKQKISQNSENVDEKYDNSNNKPQVISNPTGTSKSGFLTTVNKVQKPLKQTVQSATDNSKSGLSAVVGKVGSQNSVTLNDKPKSGLLTAGVSKVQQPVGSAGQKAKTGLVSVVSKVQKPTKQTGSQNVEKNYEYLEPSVSTTVSNTQTEKQKNTESTGTQKPGFLALLNSEKQVNNITKSGLSADVGQVGSQNSETPNDKPKSGLLKAGVSKVQQPVGSAGQKAKTGLVSVVSKVQKPTKQTGSQKVEKNYEYLEPSVSTTVSNTQTEKQKNTESTGTQKPGFLALLNSEKQVNNNSKSGLSADVGQVGSQNSETPNDKPKSGLLKAGVSKVQQPVGSAGQKAKTGLVSVVSKVQKPTKQTGSQKVEKNYEYLEPSVSTTVSNTQTEKQKNTESTGTQKPGFLALLNSEKQVNNNSKSGLSAVVGKKDSQNSETPNDKQKSGLLKAGVSKVQQPVGSAGQKAKTGLVSVVSKVQKPTKQTGSKKVEKNYEYLKPSVSTTDSNTQTEKQKNTESTGTQKSGFLAVLNSEKQVKNSPVKQSKTKDSTEPVKQVNNSFKSNKYYNNQQKTRKSNKQEGESVQMQTQKNKRIEETPNKSSYKSTDVSPVRKTVFKRRRIIPKTSRDDQD